MSRYRVVPNRNPLGTIACIGVLAGALVLAVWPEPDTPGFRARCDAEGGITVRTQDGPVCVWAGALIPIAGGRL